uniref:Transmembrane protein 106C n=1 Tax=Macaca mulatta TaxID=9544 RepID=A0A1D5QSC1_MACMU
MGSQHSAAARPSCRRKQEDDRDGLLAEREQEEAIAQFPYVEFTGRDSITCLTCQGTGYIPTEQVNELVALIPHSDQRLRPQRTKQYVLLSILLCLLASGLVVFFLFPHSVLVDDDGIKVVKVTFNKQDSLVILTIMVSLRVSFSGLCTCQAGTRDTYTCFLTCPDVNFTGKAEMGGPFSYVYFFCTVPDILVHNIVIFMRTSVKISYIGLMTQSSLETHHYVDCGGNSTAI